MLNVRELARDFNLRQEDLAQLLDCSQSVISTYYNAIRPVSRKHLQKLTEHFGEEVMKKYNITADAFFAQPRYVIRTGEVGGNVVAGNNNRVGVPEPKSEDVELIEAIEVPYVSEDLAAKPNTDVRALVRDHKVERVNVMELLGAFDFVQPVFRPAMSPLYNRGDLLFLRYLHLTNDDIIPDGEYLVDTKKYGSMLGHIHDEGDGSMTISYVNPLYSPLNILKEDAASIAIVVNHLRAGGSSLDYDVMRMLNVKEGQLNDALRIIEKSGDRADRLIEELLTHKKK